MKAIVTGGAGFIGSHLVDRLLSDGYKVIILDRFAKGLAQHLISRKHKQNLILHRVDISNSKDLKLSYFQNVDWVFHLAAVSKVAPSVDSAIIYHKINVTGTVNVLEKARIAKVKKFIYAGSASYYGIPEVFPTPETAEIKVDSPYALTKYFGEVYTLFWGKLYKFPVISLRFFNVYGPKVRRFGSFGSLFSIFMSKKIAGNPYTVVGDGTQARDFTFVFDVVDALILAAQSNITNEVFNVASGKPKSIKKMVELLGGDVNFLPKRKGEPARTWADIYKIKKMLGWKPKVKFEEGIKRALKSIKY